MKVFISVDIEGISSTTSWDETRTNTPIWLPTADFIGAACLEGNFYIFKLFSGKESPGESQNARI